jgi:hypothetical protein
MTKSDRCAGCWVAQDDLPVGQVLTRHGVGPLSFLTCPGCEDAADDCLNDAGASVD